MTRDELSQYICQSTDAVFWLAVTRGGGQWLDCLSVLTLDTLTVSVVCGSGMVETFLLEEIASCTSRPSGTPWLSK